MRYSVFFIVAFTMFALLSGCGGSSEAPHNAVDHSQMDHSSMDHSQMDHSQMQSSPGAAEAPYDLQFIDTMIAHHQGAVQMAKVGETHGSDEQLKKLAKAMAEAQEREITQMKRWRSDWFKDAKPAINMDFPGMKEGMDGMDMKKLGELKGSDFDKEFINQMIPHHEGAIKMAEDLIGQTGNKAAKPELKKLAETILKDQKDEIEYMKKLFDGWK